MAANVDSLTQNLQFNQVTPYVIDVEAEFIEITKRKLELARYPREQDDFSEDDWSQGAKVSRVEELVNYWRDEYDWNAQQVGLLNNPYSSILLIFTETSQRNIQPLPSQIRRPRLRSPRLTFHACQVTKPKCNPDALFSWLAWVFCRGLQGGERAKRPE